MKKGKEEKKEERIGANKDILVYAMCR